MKISVVFQFSDEGAPAVTTGVEGEITDVLLPAVGDLVRHRSLKGEIITGRVSDRFFIYDIPDGNTVDGLITVIITLMKLTLH